MPESSVVTLSGIRRAYPGTTAVDGVDFHLRRGEIVGLVGKNGAGKSTLMKILAGIETPDSGQVLIDGMQVSHRYDPIEASARGVAIVHQEMEIIDKLTIAENVCIGGQLPRRGRVLLDHSAIRQRAADLLDELKPGIDLSAPIAELSLAERRMVMIARALNRDAKVIILDEPSAALNDEEIVHLHKVVRQLAAKGCAVVYISHRLQEVVDLTERLVVMRDARVVDDQPTAGHDARSLLNMIVGRDYQAPAVRARSPRNGEVVLEARNLCRGTVVKDVSLQISAGEVVGLAGLAGAGRTELARLLTGTDRADSGSIVVAGELIKHPSPRRAIQAGLALIPEERRSQGLVTSFSVRENTTLASLRKHRLLGLPVTRRRSETTVTRRAVGRLRVKAADIDRAVVELSGGNQQKIVIAKWLERQPRILVFDEPTQGIDVEAKAEILRIAQELAADGCAVLLIASDFSELVNECDRVLVMREGSLVAELVGPEITEPALVAGCYAD